MTIILCSPASKAHAAPLDGVCASTAFECSVGTLEASGVMGLLISGGSYEWSCAGINGGGMSPRCVSLSNPNGYDCGGSHIDGWQAMGGSTPLENCLNASGVCLNENRPSQECTTDLSFTPPSPVDGVCGTANGTPSAPQPSSNLCSVGSMINMSTSAPWTWNCSGQNGGETPLCLAPLPPPPPSFGGACP